MDSENIFSKFGKEHAEQFKPVSNREIPVQPTMSGPKGGGGVFGAGSGGEMPVPPSPIVKIMASAPPINRPFREPASFGKSPTARPAFVPPPIDAPLRAPHPLDKFSTAPPMYVPPSSPQPSVHGFKPEVSIVLGVKAPSLDNRKMEGPIPDRHPRSGSYVGPIGGQEVSLRGMPTKIGDKCSVKIQSPLKPPPPLMPHGHLGPIAVKGFEPIKSPMESQVKPPTESQMRAQVVSPAAPPAIPSFEEPKPSISIERIVFLERVERIMASEARIKEIEGENKTLVGMVARLNKEIEELKAKLAARS